MKPRLHSRSACAGPAGAGPRPLLTLVVVSCHPLAFSAGDRIIALDANLATHIDWTGNCTKAEAASLSLLRNAVGNIRICFLRNGKPNIAIVHKKTPQALLGLVIASDKDWKHPKVREVDPLGPCFGEIKAGDNVTSIEAVKISNLSAKLDTRHLVAGSANSVVDTFLKMATGPVHVLLHRIEDEGKRWDAQAMLRASSEATLELGEASITQRGTLVAAALASKFRRNVLKRVNSRALGGFI